MEIFTGEERQGIFGSASSATIKKHLQNAPTILLKDRQVKRFRKHLLSFGIDGLYSWSKFATFLSVIDFNDETPDNSYAELKQNIEGLDRKSVV